MPEFDGDAIRSLVPFADAVSVIGEAFAEPQVHAERSVLHVAGADVLVMPAGFGDVAGVKIMAVQPSSRPAVQPSSRPAVQPSNRSRREPVIQGTYVLIDAASGRPIALLDGAALTALRTPAVGARHTSPRPCRLPADGGVRHRSAGHCAYCGDALGRTRHRRGSARRPR